MRMSWKWAAAGLVVLGLGSGVMHSLSARKEQQAAVAAATAHKADTVVELTAADVLPLQERDLQQGLPITGTLHAVNTAVVKARVPGELQQLNVREGDRVQAGQVLARIEGTEYQARLRQAQDQAEAAQAQVVIAQRQADNNQALVAQGFISKTALDTSQANLNAARASHQAALAAVDVARKAVADTQLAAPISGWVAQRLAQSGERVAAETRILEIVDLSRIELEAAVAASDAAQVHIGMPARVKVEGSADEVSAKVVRINPSTQAGSRSVLIYLAVSPAPSLRHGLFAEGRLGAGSLRTLALPLSAIRTDQPTPYVQWVQGLRVAHQSLNLGARGTAANGEPWVAVTGLPAGTQVLSGAVGPLRAGTAIRLAAAVPTSPAATASAPASAAR